MRKPSSLTGGNCVPCSDEIENTDAKELDIGLVPPPEACNDGVHDWTSEWREACSNDLSAERSLAAVAAKTNWSKAAR
ncbi:hypothetical protein [Streptomyces sp. f51]|uniref:hypothetical protein n=1 Tax=Streptomyces sp. f51 TaxID=1827742 RepID=UPI000BF14505|nr:hypothetical protein [Streptomyces sp. f51]